MRRKLSTENALEFVGFMAPLIKGLLHPCLIILLVLQLKAQENPVADPLSFAPSPSAAELGSYGHIPVGLFTGTVELNVPLYEMRTRNLVLPISLNYRSNGLLVNKVSSNVGFDWSLFGGGGSITRIVKGLPDDATKFDRVEFPFDPTKSETELTEQEKSDLVAYTLSWNSETDTQPDVYAYNFNGYSGQFYIDDDGSVVHILNQKMRIEPPLKYTPFTITSPDGIKYVFKAGEYSGEGIETSVTSYNLTQIIHPAGDVINFYYKSSGYYRYKTGITENRHVVIPSGYNSSEPCPYELPANLSPKASSSLVWTSILDSIVAEGYGKVVVITDNGRLDVPELRIKGLEIFDANGEKLRSIELFHHFPYSNIFSNDVATQGSGDPGNEDVHYRMFLDSVVIKDKINQPVQRYSFEYNDLDELPIRVSYAQDHWGYFNGANNANLLPDEIPTLIKNSWFPGANTSADREAHGQFARKGTLSKVVYPTGGYTTFEYQPHQNDEGVEFGGVRISKQSDYDNWGKLATGKNYTYSMGRSNLSNQQYFTHHNFTTYCYQPGEGLVVPVNTTFDVYWLRSSSIHSPSICANYSVGYQKVAIEDEAPNSGREEHEFEVYFDEYDPMLLYGQFPLSRAPLTNLGWKTGQKKSEKYYDKDSILIRSIQYKYKEDSSYNKTKYFVGVEQFYDYENKPWGYYEINKHFNIGRYAIISKWQYIESKIIRDYDLNGLNPVTTTVNYFYDNENHAQLSREIVTNSKGQVEEKKLFYPQDYSAISNFSTLINDKFIINKPIDIRSYRAGQIVSGRQIKYNDDGQPTDIYNAEINNSISDIPFNSSNPYTFIHREIYQYDPGSKSLLSSQKANGLVTSYVWSYGNTLPVAKIENATHSSIETAVSNLGISFLDDFGSSTNQVQIEAYLSSLRTEISDDLPEAFISTFTYKPLIGIWSSTDPNGITTYFEYDEFGRLKLIRDHEGNILKEYVYNYQVR